MLEPESAPRSLDPQSHRNYCTGELIAGKYLLVEKLGEGGMGAVWRAHNNTLDIDVAIKLLRAEELDAPDGTVLGDRLQQEARAAASLGHPAIARVFDFGASERGDPYIVMELLKGEDLAGALARRGRISASKAVSTLMPIAHALAAAHAKGIVHRDLKPENIFLARSEDGRVQPKLVDFGIAKVERTKSHRLTQTGTMLGSPIYMSPEQARGDDVDHLADVWSLCVVLYEMITGRPPFEGKNYNALLYAILADEPPSVTSLAAGDEELWAILKRGFEKAPGKRWSSVRELGIELAKWLIARGVREDISGASLAVQWLRPTVVGADALTSMIPGAVEGIEMPVIPRAGQVTVLTRSRLGAPFRQSSLHRAWAQRGALVGVLSEAAQRLRRWLETAKWTRGFWRQNQRQRVVVVAVLSSAIGIAGAAWGPRRAPQLQVSEPAVLSEPIQVQQPQAAWLAWGVSEPARAVPERQTAVEASEEAESNKPAPPRRRVARTASLRGKLKNPFER